MYWRFAKFKGKIRSRLSSDNQLPGNFKGGGGSMSDGGSRPDPKAKVVSGESTLDKGGLED